MPNEFEYDKSRLKASLDHGYLPVHVPPVSPKITAIAIVGGVTCFVVSVRSFGALWGWITLAVYVFCAWVLSGTREGLYRRKLERILDNGFAVTH